MKFISVATNLLVEVYLMIKKAGFDSGIAINPRRSIEYIRELLYVAKRIIVLGVNLGHAGGILRPM